MEIEYPDPLYEALAEVLSGCYLSIDWSKAGQKSAYDYFAARIRSAGTQCKTVPTALDHLARRCNVSAFDMDPNLVAPLIAAEKTVLRRMKDESVYVALLAAKLAKAKKENHS